MEYLCNPAYQASNDEQKNQPPSRKPIKLRLPANYRPIFEKGNAETTSDLWKVYDNKSIIYNHDLAEYKRKKEAGKLTANEQPPEIQHFPPPIEYLMIRYSSLQITCLLILQIAVFFRSLGLYYRWAWQKHFYEAHV